MDEKINVLIADDAAFMRKTIRKIFESESRFEIIGTAKNGQEAVKMNQELLPNVVTLDVDMPVMDGITALKHMMVQRPVPVVIVSSLSYETNVTFEAFRLGIVDFIPKPTGAISQELEKQKTHLCSVVKSAATVNVSKIHRIPIAGDKVEKNPRPTPTRKIAVIGGSLGGPGAFINIVTRLPASIDFAVVALVQMSAKVMDSFIHRLDKLCRVKVQKGRFDSPLHRGEVYLHSLDQPPPAIVGSAKGYVLQYSERHENSPIDWTMASAAADPNMDVGGVLLGGNDQVGIEGLAKIHRKSGKTIVQKAVNAMFSEKTRTAVQNGAYQWALNDVEIAEKLVQIMSAARGESNA